jgi:hypothetical protein
MNDTIDIIDGIPYVKSSMTDYNEPILVTRWWPLPTASGRVKQDDKCFYRGEGYYLVYTSNGGMNFRLPAGGSTEATKITRKPILPPKTRLEVRWKNDCWEKLSKRDGWIPA